ncbi:MAG: 50S ribosomal protein L22 [SAR202 cluster bacterium]|nr:50S ribosomal protein L22 [SAR202 cluster bacterium]
MPHVRASAKQIGTSPKRLRPMLDLVRGKPVNEALATLVLLPSPWAKSIAKVVQAAAANAENNMLMDREALRIVHITADGATSIKRLEPRARGRVGHITKRFSHITVVVDEDREEA